MKVIMPFFILLLTSLTIRAASLSSCPSWLNAYQQDCLNSVSDEVANECISVWRQGSVAPMGLPRGMAYLGTCFKYGKSATQVSSCFVKAGRDDNAVFGSCLEYGR